MKSWGLALVFKVLLLFWDLSSVINTPVIHWYRISCFLKLSFLWESPSSHGKQHLLFLWRNTYFLLKDLDRCKGILFLREYSFFEFVMRNKIMWNFTFLLNNYSGKVPMAESSRPHVLVVSMVFKGNFLKNFLFNKIWLSLLVNKAKLKMKIL